MGDLLHFVNKVHLVSSLLLGFPPLPKSMLRFLLKRVYTGRTLVNYKMSCFLYSVGPVRTLMHRAVNENEKGLEIK